MSGTYDSSVFISLRPLVTEKVGKASLALQNETIPGQVVPLLIWAVPLLIWSARLTSDYNAISVQLQLQLPTGTELCNKNMAKSTQLKISERYFLLFLDGWIFVNRKTGQGETMRAFFHII